MLRAQLQNVYIVPWTFCVNVAYPPKAIKTIITKEINMEAWVTLFHLPKEVSSIEQYNRNVLWWHINAKKYIYIYNIGSRNILICMNKSNTPDPQIYSAGSKIYCCHK